MVRAFNKIGWCHFTFNVWEGCFKISPGCQNCYAAAMNQWLRKGEHWERKGPRRFFGNDHWNKPFEWDRAAEKAGERYRVFCGSICDWAEIHPDRAINRTMDACRSRLWAVIEETPNLDWLMLTKRIENVHRFLPWMNGYYTPFKPEGQPWPNVWIGVTCENDEYANKRIPILKDIPAAVRFISYEPALDAIDWAPHLSKAPDVHWVIFGDESGRKRRPAELEWARQTRDACEEYGVAFYFKQWCGEDAPGLAGKREKSKIHLPILDGEQHGGFPHEKR